MNERTNAIRIAGPAEAIDAIVASVGNELYLPALVPPPLTLGEDRREAWERDNWGVRGVSWSELPVMSESNGLKVVEWDFATRGGLPFALAASLSKGNPDLVVSMSSIDLSNGEAEIRVHGDGAEWSYEADRSEIEDFETDDGAALDSLSSTAGSVVDDYELAVARRLSPSP